MWAFVRENSIHIHNKANALTELCIQSCHVRRSPPTLRLHYYVLQSFGDIMISPISIVERMSRGYLRSNQVRCGLRDLLMS